MQQIYKRQFAATLLKSYFRMGVLLYISRIFSEHLFLSQEHLWEAASRKRFFKSKYLPKSCYKFNAIVIVIKIFETYLR